MVKKRRLGNIISSPSSSRIKMESRNNTGLDDVMLARDRLKGALEDLMVRSDDESDSSQEEVVVTPPIIKAPPVVVKKEPKVIHRRRKRKDPDLDMAFQHTYVMKLYDRSVDLAQFADDTPLYPICRAWLANQPLMPYNKVKTENTSDQKNDFEELQDSTILTKITFSDSDSECEYIKDIYKLPPPTSPPLCTRIPTPEKLTLKGINMTPDSDPPPMKENLLREHLERWGQIRRNWLVTASDNEARYAESGKILTAMYKRAQKAFQ